MTALQVYLEAAMGRGCNLPNAQEEYRKPDDKTPICDICGEVDCCSTHLLSLPWADAILPIQFDSQIIHSPEAI